jgi:hypothetical protein
VKPPSHPTYDMKGVIKLALAEDAGDRGFWYISFLSLSLFFSQTKFELVQCFVYSRMSLVLIWIHFIGSDLCSSYIHVKLLKNPTDGSSTPCIQIFLK